MSQIQGNSSFDASVNVRIRQRDATTGKILRTIEGHNRVTKMALMGITRFINGEFNDTTPQIMNSYIPRYLALGSNRASTINYGVTTEVTVNDSKLLSEIMSETGKNERIKITSSTIENRANNAYIKLTLSVYIPVEQFVGETIAEAGLFANETGNNCWARITFDPIEKGTNTVIDVTWEINIVSVSNYNEAGDETAQEADILKGMTATVKGKVITGTMKNNGYLYITPGKFDQDLPNGYLVGGIIYGDENLLSRNIREGVTIFGVTGTYKGSTTVIDSDEEYYENLVNQTNEILGEDSNNDNNEEQENG